MAKKRKSNKNRMHKANNNSNKKIVLGIVILAVIIFGYSLGQQDNATNSLDIKKIDGEYTLLPVNSAPFTGKVVLTVFESFYCDHCYALDQKMPAILEKYGEQVQIIYKPMVWSGLPTKSVEAYIIAEQLGKGKEMGDALFKANFIERKDISDINELKRIAAGIGLGEEFNSNLENGVAIEQAQANLQLSQTYRVDETPSIVVNGILKVTPHDTGDNVDLMAQNLDTIIESILKQSQ